MMSRFDRPARAIDSVGSFLRESIESEYESDREQAVGYTQRGHYRTR